MSEKLRIAFVHGRKITYKELSRMAKREVGHSVRFEDELRKVHPKIFLDSTWPAETDLATVAFQIQKHVFSARARINLLADSVADDINTMLGKENIVAPHRIQTIEAHMTIIKKMVAEKLWS